MDQDASPLISGARRLYDRVTGTAGKIPPRSSAPRYDDTHERMVREANESFRTPAQKSQKRPVRRPSKRK